MHISPRLVFIHPALAEEMSSGLVKAGAYELAAQVPRLRVVEGCACGDDFCGSFYTGLRSAAVQTVVLTPYSLMVDVSAGRLTYVEVLFRPDIKGILVDAFGDGFFSSNAGRKRICPRPRRSFGLLRRQ